MGRSSETGSGKSCKGRGKATNRNIIETGTGSTGQTQTRFMQFNLYIVKTDTVQIFFLFISGLLFSYNIIY